MRRKVVRGAFDLRPPELLLAQLHDVDAAAERGAQQRFGIGAAGARVADEVEAGGAQALAPQRSLALGGSKAHPSIMAGPRRRVASGAEREHLQLPNGGPDGLRG